LIFRYGSLAPQSVPPKHGRKNFQGVNMSSSRIIDVHTHILDKDTIRPLQKEAPSVGLKLQPVDAESAVLEVAGVAYKPFPRGGFDAACRLQDMISRSSRQRRSMPRRRGVRRLHHETILSGRRQ
jgi:hypothetical protein